MRRQVNYSINNGYPYYLHNSKIFAQYWKNFFEEYPVKDNDRIEVYLDFPFCRSICKFCVYGSHTIFDYKDQIKLYNDEIINLTSCMKDVFPNRINNVYLGGGTPSLWDKDSLLKIIDNIPPYNTANMRTIEVHPVDLTDEWLHFVINDLNITTVSIGVQSFDAKSNKDQCRIPCNIDILRHAIEVLHKHGRYVNIDIIALFSPNIENGWEVFEKDLEIAASLNPDDICGSVNFRVDKFYNKTIKYRQMLQSFLEKHPGYTIEHDYSLSTDIHDIVAYGEEPYHIRTHEYHKFFNSCRVCILDTKPEILKENIMIGLGGSSKHNVISMAGKKLEKIYSYYSFNKNAMIHQVRQININEGYKAGDNIPLVRIGNCNIDPTII